MLAAVVALALATDPSGQVAALAGLYRDYDLPLPTKDAKLFCFTVHYVAQPGEEPFPPNYQFGFGLTADKGGKPTNVLIGLYPNDWVPDFATKVEEVERGASWMRAMHHDAAELPFVAQCELRGWHDLALAAFAQWRSDGKAIPNTHIMLTNLAWDYWVGQFRNDNADRAKVARRLNTLAEATGRTGSPVLTKLNLSLKPSGAQAGTAEAAIDELMDVADYRYRVRGDGLDPRLEAIYRFGFDAIPGLIAHLDDDRLTRTYHHGFFINPRFPCESYEYSVKHFVRDILIRYMGTENGQGADETVHTLKPDEVKRWWEAAKKDGEAEYLIRRVLSNEAWETEAHDQLLTAILAKYPKRFLDVLAGLKKADTMWVPLDPFVDALHRSTIPAKTQKEYLIEWLGSPDRDWQAAALTGLHRLDVDEFRNRFIAALAKLPAEEDKTYQKEPLPDYFTRFSDVARLTDDTQVWAAMGKYLGTASPEVKMAWIDRLTESAPRSHVSYAKATECVASLLSDKAVRVRGSGNQIDRTEVRNFTAKRLGDALRVRGMPTDEAPEKDWKAYREEVTKAVKKVIESKK